MKSSYKDLLLLETEINNWEEIRFKSIFPFASKNPDNQPFSKVNGLG
jgi:hypothetical protein